MEQADESMWNLLAGTVTKTPAKKRAATVAIGDSKKLYSRQKEKALEHLERGVLGVLAAMGLQPASLRRLLSDISLATLKELHHYPWYAEDDLPTPQCISPTDVAISANVLEVGLAARNIRPLGIRSEVVLPGEFNRMVDLTDNKSTVAFDAASRLLVHLWKTMPGSPVRIFVDRQGGRMRYLEPLQRIFPDCQYKIIDESETISSYRITDGGRMAEISFIVEAEDRHLPVALASMASKYLRELFMELFNRFWAAKSPHTAPTAGYAVDGKRFYEEIRPLVQSLGIDERLIYRSR